MKKIIIILLVLIGNFYNIEAQETIVLHGKIIDESTGDGIPFSTIEIMGKGIGTVANSDAVFSIKLSKINLNDTLSFRSLGYINKKFLVNSLEPENKNQIQLKPKVYQLKEVIIETNIVSNKTVRLGTYKKKTRAGYHMNRWMQISIFMENNKNYKGIIKNVSYYILKSGNPKTPFRVRIYKRDKEKNCPGEELLKESLIVKPQKKQGWFSVDVSKYNILIPEEGYFVAMEWINAGDKYYYSKIIKENYVINYGQALGNCFDYKKPYTWFYYLGYEWRNDYKLLDNNYILNAMVTSEIKIFE